jgi:2'-5' RNA ligase
VRPVPESALIVEVPEAEPLVRDWRAEHDWSAQRGVPAHITILYPFVPTEKIDKRLHADLRELFAAHPAFSFSLPRIARFPEVAWLAPEPVEPFKRLIEGVASRFPDYPPYEGMHEEVIPHLTVAEGDADLQDEVDAAITRSLPIEAEATTISLFLEDETGWWSRGERYPLSGSS